jgi:hypothetical protein
VSVDRSGAFSQQYNEEQNVMPVPEGKVGLGNNSGPKRSAQAKDHVKQLPAKDTTKNCGSYTVINSSKE